MLFFPRGGGQADGVRAVDLAANNVGLPLDVLRRPDASPAAVLGVVVAKVKTDLRVSLRKTLVAPFSPD